MMQYIHFTNGMLQKKKNIDLTAKQPTLQKSELERNKTSPVALISSLILILSFLF